MAKIIHDEQREQDLQTLCNGILEMEAIRNFNPNGADYSECPFCYAESYIDTGINEIKHSPDCVYLIAKQLS